MVANSLGISELFFLLQVNNKSVVSIQVRIFIIIVKERPKGDIIANFLYLKKERGQSECEVKDLRSREKSTF
jgi:hypothetical protein